MESAVTNAFALIALGTNLPYRGVAGPALLAQAAAALKAAGLSTRARSSIWQTDPWPPGAGAEGQPSFHNAVIELDAHGLGPLALYTALRAVEIAFGRERRERWGPRTLDLDILAMEGQSGAFQGPFGDLVLPHPGIPARAFVLAPLAEAASDWTHPELGLTASELLALLPDRSSVRRVGAFPEPDPAGD